MKELWSYSDYAILRADSLSDTWFRYGFGSCKRPHTQIGCGLGTMAYLVRRLFTELRMLWTLIAQI